MSPVEHSIHMEGPAAPGHLRVGLAQLNPTVGDLDGNIALVAAAYDRATEAGCHVLLAPELAVTGYPPEDLVHKPRFVTRNREVLERFAATTGRCAAVVGFVLEEDGRLFNAAALCVEGRIAKVYRKQHLPNYAVFDEERYFAPGPAGAAGAPAGLVEVGGMTVGISICEDIWHDDGPVAVQVAAGARVVLNINGSPFHDGKHAEREEMLARRARGVGVPVVYVNQVGGQDELVFDGSSTVVDAAGEVRCRLASFESDFGVVDVSPDGTVSSARIEDLGDDDDRVLAALVTGTRDYVRKNGFTGVVIGLSGGIDSSIVAAVAVQALGADRVHGVAMPSRYSSEGSLVDAAALAANLGIDHRVVPIEPAFSALLGMLEPSFAGREHDLTEENLQSRVRGTTLMAMSNKFGWLVLTTGNKSELAVGYFTIYGDSAGAFSVIKDVYKTRVFALCRRVNERAGREIVPESVILKPPSAELRHDQRDDQSLPPYEVLDAVLRAYVDEDESVERIVAAGHDADVVARVARLVDSAEHKRRQTAPGVRISEKAFGKDRRMPITNGYRESRA